MASSSQEATEISFAWSEDAPRARLPILRCANDACAGGGYDVEKCVVSRSISAWSST
jgi:hypothetical protein